MGLAANAGYDMFNNTKPSSSPFVGRGVELGKMAAYFSPTPRKEPRVLSICGPPGEGKTALVFEYCRQWPERYKQIFWCNAATDMTAIQSFVSIAAGMGVHHSKTIYAESIKFVRTTLQMEENPWLLVVDGYDHPDRYPDIKRLVPTGGKGDIVFTSRNQNLAFLGEVVDVAPLSDDEALKILLRSYEPGAAERYSSSWVQVVQKLGNLAISLSLAASYLHQSKILAKTPQTFIAAYTLQHEAVTRSLPDSFWSLSMLPCFSDEERARTIGAFTTWQLASTLLESTNARYFADDEYHLLTLLAFLEHTHLNESILRLGCIRLNPHWATLFVCDQYDNEISSSSSPFDNRHMLWDPEMFRAWLLRMYLLSLVTIYPTMGSGQQSFQIPSMIRDWIQVRETTESRESYTVEALRMVEQAAANIENTSTSLPSRLIVLVHMDACMLNESRWRRPVDQIGFVESTWLLTGWFVLYFSIPGRYDQARKLIERTRKAKEQVLGRNHLETLKDCALLANIYKGVGRFTEAEIMYRQTIERAKEAYGPSGHEVWLVLEWKRDLGSMLSTIQRWDDAISLYLEVVSDAEARMSSKQRCLTILLPTKALLASAYETQWRWQEATVQRNSILATSAAIFGDLHPETLRARLDLSRVLVFQGNREEAQDLQATISSTAQASLSNERHRHGVHNLDEIPSVTDSPEERSKPSREWLNNRYTDSERIRSIIAAFQNNPNDPPTAIDDNLIMPIDMIEPDNPDPAHDSIAYTALDPDGHEIRLLTIHSGKFDENIQVTLSHASFDHEPEYTALSYCWGDQTGSAKIDVNSATVEVPMSLYLALKYMRAVDHNVVAWVDFLCINQRDLEEKARQVRMMGRIYGASKLVRVWLGAPSDNSDVAMDFLNCTIDFDNLDVDTWTALRHLRMRKWWSRTWTVQEAMLAKDILFCCGWKSTQRESFTRLHEMADIHHIYGSNAKDRSFASLSIVTPFISMLNNWDDYRQQIADGKLLISNMLRMLRSSHVTEPRDKIFALLGMCRKLDQQVLKIDYRVSIRWLLIKMAKYELINQEYFQPLTLLQTTRSSKNPILPSWVPNYLDMEDDDLLTMPQSNQKIYNAAADNTSWTSRGIPAFKPFMIPHFNSIKVQIEDEGSFETLVLTGFVVDDIQTSFRTPWVDIYEGIDPVKDAEVKKERRESVAMACGEWEQYTRSLSAEYDPYKDNCGRYDAFWRTLVANCSFDRTGMPAEDFANGYEAWIGRDVSKNADSDFALTFSKPAVTRCLKRSFFVTKKGYFGLGSNRPEAKDVVCVLRGGNVPFVLRPRIDEYFTFVGEAYVHGIMDGTFVSEAPLEQMRLFKIR